MAKILTVDDDHDCLTILKGFLVVSGHEVFPLLRADRIIEAYNEVQPDLVITDLMMPGVTGGIVYHMLRKEFGSNLPIIVSSGSNLKLKLPDDPLLDYCPKPVDIESLSAKVTEMLEKAAKAKGGPGSG